MRTDTKNFSSQRGLTLIELIVAIFIFSLITVAILSVFVSTVTAYGKARAIKSVKENTEFAISSIAKDVRMGKIESSDINCIEAGTSISPKACLMVTRNRGGKVCYQISANALSICENAGASCSVCSAGYKNIIDLSGTNMTFDISTSGSGFYSCPTDTSETASLPLCLATPAEKGRGWAEMNFNINVTAGKEMETDQINVQTIVSSRDYGWEEMQ